MVRSILAVIAGFVSTAIVIMVVEAINGQVFHPELAKQAEGVTDREVVRAILAKAPISAFLVVLLGWAMGSFTGAYVAVWIARKPAARHGLILGVLVTLAGILNNLMIPPPLWFWIPSLVIYLPAAYVGAQLAPRPAAAPVAAEPSS